MIFYFYLYFVPVLPSNGSEAVLSASDLCAPPLKPLILQPKDKANLIEWFKSLWSTTIDSKPLFEAFTHVLAMT